MDIEKLTKAQIILLTLLVSFVTSIATGIFTVTLLDQAPPAVTQTINKVIERTIERIVPDESLRASVVTEEVIVVVREDDLITDSIEKNMRSLVTIYKDIVTEEGQSASVLVGDGVVMTGDGIIATDSSVIRDGVEYRVVLSNGEEYTASVLAQDETMSVALLSVIAKTAKDGEKIPLTLSPIVFSRESGLKLGQTVISLSMSRDASVSTGVISGLRRQEVVVENDDGKESIKRNILVALDTSIQGSVAIGSPVINIFGEVLGMNLTGSRNNSGRYLPIENVLSLLDAVSSDSEDQG